MPSFFMSNSIALGLTYLSIGFSILALVIGLWCIKSIKKYLIPFFLIVSIAALVEISSLFIFDTTINNLTIFHFYTAFEFTLIFLFYVLFYRQYFKLKFLYLLLPCFYLINYFDNKLNGINEMDNFSVTIESSFFIIISLASFFFIIRHLIFENIVAMPFFWINSAILIYFSGNMVLFVVNKSLPKEDFYILYSFINSPLNILYNLLICIGFWKSRNS